MQTEVNQSCITHSTGNNESTHSSHHERWSPVSQRRNHSAGTTIQYRHNEVPCCKQIGNKILNHHIILRLPACLYTACGIVLFNILVPTLLHISDH